MIIECSACSTRFRLDEARIKGRGARVRCRRCGESILVLKPGEPQAQARTDSDSLDLRSAVRESFEGRREAGKDAAAITPAPPGLDSAAPASPFVEMRPPGKDDIDLAFDKILFSGRTEEPAPAMEEEPEDLAIDFRPEEKVDLTGDKLPDLVTDFETSPGASFQPPEEAGREEAAAVSAPSDFMVSDADTLDFLKKEYGKEKEDKAPAELDISGSLRRDPAIPLEPEEVPETPLRASGPAPDAEKPVPLPPQDYEAQLIEAAAPALDPAINPPPVETPPEREPTPEKEPLPSKQPEPWKPVSRSLRPSPIALLLVFLALSGGGAYLGFTKGGQDLLRGLFPGMESLWKGGVAKSGPQFDLRNLIGYYERDTNAGDLFIIKGQIVNAGRTRKNSIRIHAGILDDKDRTIGETSCYAGNDIPGETLRTATREKIEEMLSNRFGDRLVNIEIPPGKSVPFKVVFFDAPDGISAYRLEVKEGE
ncbi:MAG: Znf/thioredoxin put protein [Actinobacteria bacterium]|nr:Znf/thioredoxin put protein [Actinomycetota bacterium]